MAKTPFHKIDCWKRQRPSVRIAEGITKLQPGETPVCGFTAPDGTFIPEFNGDMAQASVEDAMRPDEFNDW